MPPPEVGNQPIYFSSMAKDGRSALLSRQLNSLRRWLRRARIKLFRLGQ